MADFFWNKYNETHPNFDGLNNNNKPNGIG